MRCQRTRKQGSLDTESTEHPQKCTQFNACTQHSCFSQQHCVVDQFFFWSLGAVIESAHASPQCSSTYLQRTSTTLCERTRHEEILTLRIQVRTSLFFVCINVSNPSTYLAVIRLEENHHSKGHITASGERIPDFDRKTVCTIATSSKASHFEGTTNP